MASNGFSSQFSLSLELTRLLPLGAIANAGGRALIQLTRELRKSGSDIVVEEDLADVFGRNRISAQFESSFRTAVQGTRFVEIPSLIDIVLEAGAGPTVRRSVKNRAYLSTVIQLSLLTYTHSLQSLTKALIKALEQRGSGSGDRFIEVPNHGTLFGTLATIRDQSSGYRWDLIFSAVDQQLTGERNDHIDIGQLRRLPFAVLQALLDTFTAIQHFPEQRLLRIKASSGITTIVVWAHHVLGMTTAVVSSTRNRNSESSTSTNARDNTDEANVRKFDSREPMLRGIARFGDGLEQVLIEWIGTDGSSGLDSVTLMSASDNPQLDFTMVANPFEDVPLHAHCRHALSGYGTKMLLNEDVRSTSLQRDITHLILALCMKTVQKSESKVDQYLPFASAAIPSASKILSIGEMLFPGLVDSRGAIEALSHLPCLEGFMWLERKLPYELRQSLRELEEQRQRSSKPMYPPPADFVALNLPLDDMWRAKGSILETMDRAPAEFLSPVIASLARLVLALTSVVNISECEHLPLTLSADLPIAGTSTFVRVYTPREAFEYLTSLLWGQSFVEDPTMRKSTLVSQMGWSIMLGCLHDTGPSNIQTGLTVHYGVPARNQERGNWIMDPYENGELVTKNLGAGYYCVEKRAGEKMKLKSVTSARHANPLISSTFGAFEVIRRLEIVQQDQADEMLGFVKTGFREMQELCWNAVRVPACAHGNQSGKYVNVPEGCVAFSGWQTKTRRNDQVARWEPNVPIHLAMVSGNEAARWVLLYTFIRWYWAWDDWVGKDETPVAYIRPPSCCVPCAAEIVKIDRPGFPKILIL